MMVDILQGLKDKRFLIELPSHLWHTVDSKVLQIVKSDGWKYFKFYTEEGERSAEISKISRESGGIYVFYIKLFHSFFSPSCLRGK